MTKEITEDEVRKDVMVFANILFERGMTDDLLGVVDAWVSEWRSGAMFHSAPRAEAFTGRPDTVNKNCEESQGMHPSAGHELNQQNAKRQ